MISHHQPNHITFKWIVCHRCNHSRWNFHNIFDVVAFFSLEFSWETFEILKRWMSLTFISAIEFRWKFNLFWMSKTWGESDIFSLSQKKLNLKFMSRSKQSSLVAIYLIWMFCCVARFVVELLVLLVALNNNSDKIDLEREREHQVKLISNHPQIKKTFYPFFLLLEMSSSSPIDVVCLWVVSLEKLILKKSMESRSKWVKEWDEMFI